MNPSEIDDRNEIHQLRDEVATLRAQVAELRQHAAPERTTTRRDALKLAGAAVAGGAVALASGAGQASASSGQPLLVDRTNYSPQRTILRSGTDSTSPGSPGSIGYPNPLLQILSTDAADIPLGIQSSAPLVGVLSSGANAGGSAYWSFGGDYGYRSIVSNKADFVFAGIRSPSIPKLPPPQRTDGHAKGELDMDGDGTVWLCVANGTPGTWKRVAGPGPDGRVIAVPPQRVYDSRVPAPAPGVLVSGQNRTVSVADGRSTTSGAVETVGLVPVGATAVLCNVTVVTAQGSGFLTINPGGDATIRSSTINWFGPNQLLANGVSLSIAADRTVTVIAGGGGTTDFLLDVSGYVI